MTSFQGYTGQLFVVCLLKGQLNYWELTGQVILHTFPGKDRCVYLDRPHPRLRVLDVDNFSRVGNMQELRQAITLPHQLPWRSNTGSNSSFFVWLHAAQLKHVSNAKNWYVFRKNKNTECDKMGLCNVLQLEYLPNILKRNLFFYF